MIEQGGGYMAGITELAAMVRVMVGGRPSEATITLFGADNGEEWLAWRSREGIDLTILRADRKPPSSPSIEVRLKGRKNQKITICGATIGGMQIIELFKQVDGTDRRMFYLTEKARDVTDSASSLQALISAIATA
mgnify:CR=1 FL=1